MGLMRCFSLIYVVFNTCREFFGHFCGIFITVLEQNKVPNCKHVQKEPQIWLFFLRETLSQKGPKTLPSAYFVELIQLEKLCVSIIEGFPRCFGLFFTLSNDSNKLFDDTTRLVWLDRTQKYIK